MSDERPIPRIECVTCDTFWSRSSLPNYDEVVPVLVSSPIKRKRGLPTGQVGLEISYYHLPCRDVSDPEKGKIKNFFIDPFGRRAK